MTRLKFLLGLTVLFISNGAVISAPKRDIAGLLSQFSIVALSYSDGKVDFLKAPLAINQADQASISSFFSEQGKQYKGCICFYNVRSGKMIFVKLEEKLLIEVKGERFETTADEISSRLKRANERK